MFKNAHIETGEIYPQNYHKAKLAITRGHPDFPVSPSMLKEFDACPKRWRDGYVPPETDAKSYGSLLDTMVLTPKVMLDFYTVRPSWYRDDSGVGSFSWNEEKPEGMKPWSGNSTVCKEWLLRQGEKEIVNRDDMKEAADAIKALFSDEKIRDFIQASRKQVLVRGEWHDQDGFKIPVECLIDLVNDDLTDCIGDLKTSRNAKRHVFRQFAWQRGYHVQAAFDLGLFNAATGEMRTTWCLIVSENFPPYQTARRMFGQKFIELGKAEVDRILGNYCWCLKNNIWPDYDHDPEGKWTAGGWGVIDPTDQMILDAQFAPVFADAKASEPADEPPPVEEEEEDGLPKDWIP